MCMCTDQYIYLFNDVYLYKNKHEFINIFNFILKKEFIGPGLHLMPVYADHA